MSGAPVRRQDGRYATGVAARPFVPVAPHLPTEFVEAEDVTLGADERWEGLSLTAQFDGQVAEDLDVSGCRLVGASFLGSELVRARVSDTVFERCDLSAAGLAKSVLTRVAFVDCRLSGVDLSGAQLSDVSFSDCRVVEANLRMCTGKRVRFDHCDLSGAELQAARFADGCFFDSDLTGVDLSQASLDQARLHGSTIGSLRGAAALRGTTIASAQLVPVAVQLLALFEIHVDDEREPPPP